MAKSFKNNVKAKWSIVLSSADLDLPHPTKEELLDLITASLPNREIASQICRLAAHLVKVVVYGKTTSSWQRTIRDSVAEIQFVNTRRKAKGVYFDLAEMQEMFRREWPAVLTWVAKESRQKWTTAMLKKRIKQADVWGKMEKLGIEQRTERTVS